jgi:hypothetical protein
MALFLILARYLILRARRKAFGDTFPDAPTDAKVGEALIAGGRVSRYVVWGSIAAAADRSEP